MATVTRKIIDTKHAPAAIGPYSQAVQVGNTLYISGSLGLIPGKTELIDGGVRAETHQSIKNIEAILVAAGGSLNNVVSTTVLLADINDFAAVNEIYKTYFTSHFPARAAYQVAALPKGGKIEIQSIAVLGNIEDA